MHKNEKNDLNALMLAAHRKGVENAVDLSIRTGVPLVIEKNGVIQEVKPKYKYVRVLIEEQSQDH